MTVTIQTYRPTLTAGQVYLRVAGSSAPLRAVGNCSQLDLEISEDVKDLTDYTQPAGGRWASVSRVKSIDAAIKLHDLDAENLAMATYGTSAQVAAGTVAAEVATAVQGGLIRLAHPAPTSVVITSAAAAWVTATAYAVGAIARKTTTNNHVYRATTAGTSGATEPIWQTDGTTTTDGTVVWADLGAVACVSGTDYEVRPEGIMILGAGIPNYCPLSIAYSYGAYSAIEGIIAGQLVYEVVFGGLNAANSSSPVVVDIWRLQISAAKKIGLIGDDFAALELTGRVLRDNTKAAGRSGYFREQLV